MEKISVIIPIYRVEQFINECIDSVIKQSYSNIEIILVDDGSPDRCGLICDEYLQMDSRIKVIHKENGGLSDARNKGIDVATGSYIVFIDSDDYIDSDMISFLYNGIIRENADIFCCNRYFTYDNKKEIYGKQNIYNSMNSEEAIYSICHTGYQGHCAYAKIYKIELFNNIRYPKGKINEDVYTTYKLFDRAQKIVYDSTPKYYYRQRNNSITKSKKVNYDIIDASKELMEFVENKYPEIKKAAECMYIFSIAGVYDTILKCHSNDIDKKKSIIKEIKIRRRSCKEELKKEGKKRYMQVMLLSHVPIVYDIVFFIYNKYKNSKKIIG